VLIDARKSSVELMPHAESKRARATPHVKTTLDLIEIR
jgi:hypothetical protein